MEHLLHQALDLPGRDVVPETDGHHALRRIAHRAAVHVGIQDPELVEAVDHPDHVQPSRGEHRLNQAAPGLPLHLQHHAEVEQDDPAGRVHQQVAGVRVGVKDAVLQHHLEIKLD
ncbi:MAG TPA: hypothetical protein VFI77_03090 [Gemmatimonadales bacterium]|nr:hypothetical protein [Gemmatimonadales bacterium]